MSIRLASVVLILFALPISSQQSNIQERARQRIWFRAQTLRSDPPDAVDLRVARLQIINHDAADLSTLSTSLQSDLHALQRGLLAKDLQMKLKKIEKLSKKLRLEMEP